jgi:acyl-CoA thioesterase YciA
MSVCSIERDAPDEHQMTDSQAVHAPLNTESEPCGDLSIRTLAMPADTNQNGDIFGGWLLSQMDLGGGIFASKVAKSRTVTVAIEAMNFRKPVFVGDLVSVHANLVRIGKTSITVHIEAWVLRRKETHSILVTDGNFTYVSIDDQGHPQAIKRDGQPLRFRHDDNACMASWFETPGVAALLTIRGPHPEEATTGPHEARPDDELRAVSKDEATVPENALTHLPRGTFACSRRYLPG